MVKSARIGGDLLLISCLGLLPACKQESGEHAPIHEAVPEQPKAQESSVSSEPQKAAEHYRQFHDLASLEVVARTLRIGMPQEEVENLLGEPDWPVNNMQGYYISDLKDENGRAMTLIVEYGDSEGKPTGRLEHFEMSTVSE